MSKRIGGGMSDGERSDGERIEERRTGRMRQRAPLLVFSPRVAFPTVVKKDFRHGYLF